MISLAGETNLLSYATRPTAPPKLIRGLPYEARLFSPIGVKREGEGRNGALSALDGGLSLAGRRSPPRFGGTNVGRGRFARRKRSSAIGSLRQGFTHQNLPMASAVMPVRKVGARNMPAFTLPTPELSHLARVPAESVSIGGCGAAGDVLGANLVSWHLPALQWTDGISQQRNDLTVQESNLPLGSMNSRLGCRLLSVQLVGGCIGGWLALTRTQQARSHH